MAKVTGPWTLPKPTNLVSKPPILMESRCGRFTRESYRQASSGLSMLGLSDQCQIQGVSYLTAVADVDRSRVADLLAKALSGAGSAFEFQVAGEHIHQP